MIVFVTSIRHPTNSEDYARVERLLGRTLRSIDGQHDRRFRAIAVGNRPPSVPLPASADFVQVDFPPPSPAKTAKVGREAILADKGTKLAVGVLAAARYGPTHVMTVDADDFVSNRISGFVNERPKATGWYVDVGYKLLDSANVVAAVERFNEQCGTSLILPFDALGVPELPLHATQDEVYAGFGEFTVRELLGSHRMALTHFRDLGRPLERLPFRGAVYVVGTGENAWSHGDFDGLALPVRRTQVREFGLDTSVSRRTTVAFLTRHAARTALRHAGRSARRLTALVRRNAGIG
jgi:hypothetical protein